MFFFFFFLGSTERFVQLKTWFWKWFCQNYFQNHVFDVIELYFYCLIYAQKDEFLVLQLQLNWSAFLNLDYKLDTTRSIEMRDFSFLMSWSMMTRNLRIHELEFWDQGVVMWGVGLEVGVDNFCVMCKMLRLIIEA